MCERILAQNCEKFDNFNFEFSMSHHNAHYQSYKNAPADVTDQNWVIHDFLVYVQILLCAPYFQYFRAFSYLLLLWKVRWESSVQ